MSKGKYQNSRRKGSKTLAALLAMVLTLTCVVGGTIAWLTSKTDPVENTFTVGNIDIELKETTDTYKMVPGWTIDKDPLVTVKAGSEDCWVFIKVEESVGEIEIEGKTYSFADFIDYQIDPNNWKKLEEETNVYYCEVTNVTADRVIKVLGYMNGTEYVNNKVLVKDTVTKEMMDAIDGDNNPKLTFTAYAVQLYKNNTEKFTATEAWNNAKALDNTGSGSNSGSGSSSDSNG